MRLGMAIMQQRPAFFPVVAFRWLAWALMLGMLTAGIPPSSDASLLLHATLVVYTTVYIVLWTIALPRVSRLATVHPPVLLADVLLSAVPMFATGGWRSPFVLFAFGALMLPGALWGWRGSLVAFVAYLLVDQVAGWSTYQPGDPVPFASFWGLLGYGRPLIAASIWPLSVEHYRWRTRQPTQARRDPAPPGQVPSATGMLLAPPTDAPLAAIDRAGSSGAITAWSIAPQRFQTLEHPPLIELETAIRHAVAEAEEQGLSVHLVMDVPRQALPQGHIQVLAKTLEVGLENVRRHAHTQDAEVVVAGEERGVRLILRDHGTGLLDGTAEPPGFHQLRRLRYRVEEIEGLLHVTEDDAGGVVVTAWVPYAEKSSLGDD